MAGPTNWSTDTNTHTHKGCLCNAQMRYSDISILYPWNVSCKTPLFPQQYTETLKLFSVENDNEILYS